ncbi:hypothetical protein LTR37_010318 [Vermiconidia calcicola]|uniref:Uncharacterized protein n=1 Tax=Vermiconidia calcicola TaxID=1690605 RepID=A0ACC3N5F3_9PEZI|nr:hypothetical protein LTR37_010318 [Vermiconidia calcicola]
MLSLISYLVIFATVAFGQATTPQTAASSTSSPTADTDAILRSLSLAASASSTITGDYPTATLLLAGNVSSGYAGALIRATSCRTTYALSCTDNKLCSTYTATVTQGAFDYVADYYSSTLGVAAFLSQSCSLLNLASAVCSVYVSVSHNQTATESSTINTVSGADLQYAQVPITVGGELLENPGAAPCSLTGSIPSRTTTSSASSGSGNSSQAVKVGIGVGVGASGALLLAGVVGVLIWRRRHRSKSSTGADSDHKFDEECEHQPPPYPQTSRQRMVQPQRHMQELPVGHEVQELPNHTNIVELAEKATTDDEKYAGISPQELPAFDVKRLR